MTRQPSSWDHCVRGLLLVAALLFATSLSIADMHYAKGWPPASLQQGWDELLTARRTYPYLPRFREGLADRLKLVAEKGI